MRVVAILAMVWSAHGAVPKDPHAPVPVIIRATGTGRPPPGRTGRQAYLMARRAAEVVAVRNLAVKLDAHRAERRRGRYAVTRHRLVRGFRYLPPRTLPDGRVEVTVEMPLGEPRAKIRSISVRAGRVQSRVNTTLIHKPRCLRYGHDDRRVRAIR